MLMVVGLLCVFPCCGALGGWGLLRRLDATASSLVASTEGFVDPKLGTWADCPVGGAAERDGSWLTTDARRLTAEVMRRLGTRPGAAKALTDISESRSYEVGSDQRYQVRLLALALGSAVRDTQPCGTVTTSVVLEGRVRTTPLRRDPVGSSLERRRPWVERTSSARVRDGSAGVVTVLGGPPRAVEAASNRALLLEVSLRPPVDETVRVDGPSFASEALNETDAEAWFYDLKEQQQQQGGRLTKTAAGGAAVFDGGGGVNADLTSHVGGLDEEIAELRRRVLGSRRLSEHQARTLGVSHVRGVLLHGPPGCGKTLLARQLATTLEVDDDCLDVVNGPELLDKFVGVAERRVRDLFAKPRDEWARYRRHNKDASDSSSSSSWAAASLPPLRVIVFDEIDALCRERGAVDDTTGVRDSVTAQLLACLDGVDAAGNVLVVATTNRPELLDRALLRPGRLEVKIHVPPPRSRRDKQSVVRVHAAKILDTLENDDAKKFLFDGNSPLFDEDQSPGFSGADFAGFVRNALAIALDAAFRFEAGNDDDDDEGGGEIPVVVKVDDLRAALAAIRAEKLAHTKTGKKKHAWPQLALYESLWREEQAAEDVDEKVLATTPPESLEAARDILEFLAYDKRRIRLPIDRQRVDDLAYHFFRYLRASS